MNDGVMDFGKFVSQFASESDRGAALIAAAFLDERLLTILEAFLADIPERKKLLRGFNSPLGTMSARALACLTLGLIDDREFKEITIFREIRNKFAHSWPKMGFDDGEVSKLCRALPLDFAKPEDTNRVRFNSALAVLVMDLMWRTEFVAAEKRQLKAWPQRARA